MCHTEVYLRVLYNIFKSVFHFCDQSLVSGDNNVAIVIDTADIYKHTNLLALFCIGNMSVCMNIYTNSKLAAN